VCVVCEAGLVGTGRRRGGGKAKKNGRRGPRWARRAAGRAARARAAAAPLPPPTARRLVEVDIDALQLQVGVALVGAWEEKVARARARMSGAERPPRAAAARRRPRAAGVAPSGGGASRPISWARLLGRRPPARRPPARPAPPSPRAPVGDTPCSSATVSQNLAPIWLPHCPAWMWTISRMVAGEGGRRARVAGAADARAQLTLSLRRERRCRSRRRSRPPPAFCPLLLHPPGRGRAVAAVRRLRRRAQVGRGSAGARGRHGARQL